jgi:hypothetical protein
MQPFGESCVPPTFPFPSSVLEAKVDLGLEKQLGCPEEYLTLAVGGNSSGWRRLKNQKFTLTD